MNTLTYIPIEPRSRVTRVAELAPDDRLHLDDEREQVLSVIKGVLVVALAEDDAILTPGDFVTVGAGVRARAWNGGDEDVRVVVCERA
jgi:mannose-6-phosphate isomerase-like protein (cupin superfamily)